MSAAVFEVPVVFQDLPRHETYAQLCSSLASLVDASDRIFTCLSDRLDHERGACVCWRRLTTMWDVVAVEKIVVGREAGVRCLAQG
jgi:hypothetical protein